MTKLRFLTAGESHGPALTAIVEGFPAGVAIGTELINRDLRRRQGGYGRGGRMDIEQDTVAIEGGVLAAYSTGSPIALRIENRDWPNWRDRWVAGDLPRITVPRPGHADYAGMVKYGLNDARPVLERASARETAARVAVGAIAKQLLAAFKVEVIGYVRQIGDVEAAIPDITPKELWQRAEDSDVRCPDTDAASRMREAIDAARQSGDSLGGTFVIVAAGVPAGLGSYAQWDRRLDGRLSAAVMSIPAIKGVEIGEGFASAGLPGTKVHDELFTGDDGRVYRETNRAGGIEGGVSNGKPIVLHAAMKPIPTTLTPLSSVNMETAKPASTEYQRSDVCAAPAASVVGEAMVAWTLAEALVEKYGGDSLAEMKR